MMLLLLVIFVYLPISFPAVPLQRVNPAHGDATPSVRLPAAMGTAQAGWFQGRQSNRDQNLRRYNRLLGEWTGQAGQARSDISSDIEVSGK